MLQNLFIVGSPLTGIKASGGALWSQSYSRAYFFSKPNLDGSDKINKVIAVFLEEKDCIL